MRKRDRFAYNRGVFDPSINNKPLRVANPESPMSNKPLMIASVHDSNGLRFYTQGAAPTFSMVIHDDGNTRARKKEWEQLIAATKTGGTKDLVYTQINGDISIGTASGYVTFTVGRYGGYTSAETSSTFENDTCLAAFEKALEILDAQGQGSNTFAEDTVAGTWISV